MFNLFLQLAYILLYTDDTVCMRDLLKMCFIFNRFFLLHKFFNKCFIFLDVYFYIYKPIKTK